MGIKNGLKNSKLGYFFRICSYVYRLPRYVVFFETHLSTLDEAASAQTLLNENSHRSSQELSERLSSLEEQQRNINERMADIKHLQLVSKQPKIANTIAPQPINSTMADDHEHDNFYKLFEDKFRGS